MLKGTVFKRILSLLLIYMSSSNGFAADRLVDATGVPVEAAKSKRIVSLAPSLTEIVAEFLKRAGDKKLSRLVGVSSYSDYPAEVKNISKVGPYVKVNVEKVIALKPDLILATMEGNSLPQIEQFRSLGKRVVVVSTFSLEEIRDSILIVAQALGAKDGKKVSDEFYGGIKRAAARVRKLQLRGSKSAMIQVGHQPVVVAGGASSVTEVFSLLGYKNVFSDSSMSYPKPSREEVLRRNPDYIFVMNFSGSGVNAQDAVSQWLSFKKLNAVQNKSVIIIDGDDWVRPTFRMINAVKRFEKVLRNLSKKTGTEDEASKL